MTTTGEGSLKAPTRHPILWQDPDFLDKEKLDQEMERQFDVCHGCRRCFNLCQSFPTLFDLIDGSPTGELDGVQVEDYAKVVDDCTLCDMCYMVKCPYVPPHEFNIDFPHLMLRYKAYQHGMGQTPFVKEQLAKTDRNASVLSMAAPLVNGVIQEKSIFRKPLEAITNIDHRASMPSFSYDTLMHQLKKKPIVPLEKPLPNEKVVLYATCYGNYHETEIGLAAFRVLRKLGVDVRVDYPGCCGMPQLENGDIKAVADKAKRVAAFFEPLILEGYRVLSLIPSCALMLKSEWPLLYPKDPSIHNLKAHTLDISEYIVYLFETYGVPDIVLPDHMKAIILQLACHSRAQNMGPKAAQMLRMLVKDQGDVHVIDRCSGHGGTWGMMKQHFDTALKVGGPVFKHAAKIIQKEKDASDTVQPVITSECPLAGAHIRQGLQEIGVDGDGFKKWHPLQIVDQLLH